MTCLCRQRWWHNHRHNNKHNMMIILINPLLNVPPIMPYYYGLFFLLCSLSLWFSYDFHNFLVVFVPLSDSSCDFLTTSPIFPMTFLRFFWWFSDDFLMIFHVFLWFSDVFSEFSYFSYDFPYVCLTISYSSYCPSS